MIDGWMYGALRIRKDDLYYAIIITANDDGVDRFHIERTRTFPTADEAIAWAQEENTRAHGWSHVYRFDPAPGRDAHGGEITKEGRDDEPAR